MDDHLDTLKAGKRVMEDIETELSVHYLIDGKTPEQWHEAFRINVPAAATTEDIKRCNAQLVMLLNEATFYMANAQLIFDAIEQGSRDKYVHKFEAKVREYQQADKKLPSQKTLEALAESSMMDLNGAKANAAMKLRFWKHILGGLSEQRKSLEQIMWSINIETKMEINNNGGF